MLNTKPETTREITELIDVEIIISDDFEEFN
jgi:hypothetical protein